MKSPFSKKHKVKNKRPAIIDLAKRYTDAEIERIDKLLDMAVTINLDNVPNGNMDKQLSLTSGILKVAVLLGYFEPLHTAHIAKEYPYLFKVLTAFVSSKYENRADHVCNSLNMPYVSSFVKYYSKNDMPTWLLFDAMLKYGSVIEFDYEAFNKNIQSQLKEK